MINEHDRVVLLEDVASASLEAGDVGTVVHIYESARAYEVEFVTLTGQTAAVVTLNADKVRPVRPADLPHARQRVA